MTSGVAQPGAVALPSARRVTAAMLTVLLFWLVWAFSIGIGVGVGSTSPPPQDAGAQ